MKKSINIIVIALFYSKYCFSYRITILDDASNACNNKTCYSPTRDHSACYPLLPSDKCQQFEFVQFTSAHINNLLNGHNGLRNRVAKNWKKPAANMNYLHWSLELQRMAQGWIMQCTLNIDSCNFIYDDTLTVGQNIMFLKKFRSKKWGSSIIRNWFLEGNSIDNSIIDKFVEGKESNYTQLVWANTEFVGCAAARMFKGIFMVCNYHPKGNIPNFPVYKVGKPCSNCNTERPMCGKVFNGLCGFDGFFINAVKKLLSNLILVFKLICITFVFSN